MPLNSFGSDESPRGDPTVETRDRDGVTFTDATIARSRAAGSRGSRCLAVRLAEPLALPLIAQQAKAVPDRRSRVKASKASATHSAQRAVTGACASTTRRFASLPLTSRTAARSSSGSASRRRLASRCQRARRSASVVTLLIERRTARSHSRATRPPHQLPAAQKSVPSSPCQVNSVTASVSARANDSDTCGTGPRTTRKWMRSGRSKRTGSTVVTRRRPTVVTCAASAMSAPCSHTCNFSRIACGVRRYGLSISSNTSSRGAAIVHVVGPSSWSRRPIPTSSVNAPRVTRSAVSTASAASPAAARTRRVIPGEAASAGAAELGLDRVVGARLGIELRERKLEDVVRLLVSALPAMGDAEIGHDLRLVLLVAEVAQRRGGLLEEADRPVVVAGVAQGERQVGLRQRDGTAVVQLAQDLERSTVAVDGLVVAAVSPELRAGRVEAEGLTLRLGARRTRA